VGQRRWCQSIGTCPMHSRMARATSTRAQGAPALTHLHSACTCPCSGKVLPFAGGALLRTRYGMPSGIAPTACWADCRPRVWCFSLVDDLHCGAPEHRPVCWMCRGFSSCALYMQGLHVCLPRRCSLPTPAFSCARFAAAWCLCLQLASSYTWLSHS